MRVVIDIEANSLTNPTKIWLVVCKDIDTNQVHIFRNLHEDSTDFKKFANGVSLWIGHNCLDYDFPVLRNIISFDIPDPGIVRDTLILSRLIDYPRPVGHSLESYGQEFNYSKLKNSYPSFFSQWSQGLEDYCVRDCEICHRIYLKYSRVINDHSWLDAIRLEHSFQLVVNSLHSNGFFFNKLRANKLLDDVSKELSVLDKNIAVNFLPCTRYPKRIQERRIIPRLTKHGTLNRNDFRWVKDGNLSDYNGGPFCKCNWTDFNPASHKQIIEVLQRSGWSPTEKTETHKDTEQEINRLKYSKDPNKDLTLALLQGKLRTLQKTGWRINENNLITLPADAPSSARTLARRILYESRRRTLVEWLSLVNHEIRIEKESFGILGIEEKEKQIQSFVTENEQKEEDFTGRTPKRVEKIDEKPTSNILTDLRSKNLINWLKTKKVNAVFVKENASYLWITVTGQDQFEGFCAGIVTVLSDGTKQEILKYKITSERINGRFQGIGAWTHRMSHREPNTANIPNALREDGSTKLLGKELRSLWSAPKNRLLVGVDAEGIQFRIFAHYVNDKELTQALVSGKKSNKTDPHSLNADIIGSCTRQQAKRFIYALLLGGGVSKLGEILAGDKQRGQEALDRILKRYPGFDYLRREVIPSDAQRGYFIGLDGRRVPIPGDTVGNRKHLCMSGYLQNGEAILMKKACLKWESKLHEYDALLVNFVHDEWQVECPNDWDTCMAVAKLMSDSLVTVGEELKLNCPMAGSYYNEDNKDYTFGTNWYQTH